MLKIVYAVYVEIKLKMKSILCPCSNAICLCTIYVTNFQGVANRWNGIWNGTVNVHSYS